MSTIKEFWDLEAWKKAHELAILIYKLTNPEKFSLQAFYCLAESDEVNRCPTNG